MRPSLGDRLRSTRELLGMTQEQVIEQLESRFSLGMSQQNLSTIENGKRKVDAEKELPALAAIYGKAIDYFYQSLEIPVAQPSDREGMARRSPLVKLRALTQRDKLELAIELLQSLLEKP